MLSNMFESSTIPMLQQVVGFAQARHTVLAGNIANLDTPGYQVRDLSVDDFQQRLEKAVERQRDSSGYVSPGELVASGEVPMAPTSMANVAKDPKTILYHDESNVGMEFQVTEMVKNQMLHNTALSLMNAQFRLLEAAVSGRL